MPSCKQVFTIKFLALKKLVFPPIENTFQFFFDFFYLHSMQLFSADPKIFSKFRLIFVHKNFKNRPQKLLIIGPNPFTSQSSSDYSPQPRIGFSYHEISGPDICSLICDGCSGCSNLQNFGLSPFSSPDFEAFSTIETHRF